MAKYWIIPRVGDKELPRVGHLTGLLQSPHFLCSYKGAHEKGAPPSWISQLLISTQNEKKNIDVLTVQ